MTDGGRWVHETLIGTLNEVLARVGYKFRAIFAGRYIGPFMKGFPLLHQELQLSPFNHEATRTFIQQTLERFESFSGQELDYTSAELDRFAEETLDITGGHPKAIARLIQSVFVKRKRTHLMIKFRPTSGLCMAP